LRVSLSRDRDPITDHNPSETDLTHLHLLGPWSPTRSPTPTTFTTLSNLRNLSITLHGLCDLLDAEIQRDDSLVTFSAVKTLSLHEANVSLSSWLRPRTPRARNLLDNFPNLSLISSPASYKNELAAILPLPDVSDRPTSTTNSARSKTDKKRSPSILWRMQWQAFVDYMPPYRWFGLFGDTDSLTPSASVLAHLTFTPLPYSPIPDHFLLEVTNRIKTDPSLERLRTLWLDREWESIGTREMREEWENALSERDVVVHYVSMKGNGLEGWEGRVEEEVRTRWMEEEKDEEEKQS
jgi:hypothetical protein